MEEKKAPRHQGDRDLAQAKKRERVPFGVPQSKLDVQGKDPNYHYRWVNDNDGGVQKAEMSGYEFVGKEEVGLSPAAQAMNTGVDTKVRLLGGRDKGQPFYMYLMKVPKEWYEEDKEALADMADSNDATIRSGRKGLEGQDLGNYYKSKVSLEARPKKIHRF